MLTLGLWEWTKVLCVSLHSGPDLRSSLHFYLFFFFLFLFFKASPARSPVQHWRRQLCNAGSLRPGAPRDHHGVRMWRQRAVTDCQLLPSREWEHAAFCMFGTHTMLSLVPSLSGAVNWDISWSHQPVSCSASLGPSVPHQKVIALPFSRRPASMITQTRSAYEQYQNNTLCVSYYDCCSVAGYCDSLPRCRALRAPTNVSAASWIWIAIGWSKHDVTIWAKAKQHL